MGVTKVLNSKSDPQTCARLLAVMPFDRPTFIVTMSLILIVHNYRDIFAYFPKYKKSGDHARSRDIRMPLCDQANQ